MAYLGYWLKDVRVENSVSGSTTADLDKDKKSVEGEHFLYTGAASSTIASAANALNQVIVFAVVLKLEKPNIYRALVQQGLITGPNSGAFFDTLKTVYSDAKAQHASTGKFVFRVGKRVYSVGYAYSTSTAGTSPINASTTHYYKV